MFKPVKITTSDINKLLLDGTANENFSSLYEGLSKKLRTHLTKDIIRQTVIDGTRLQEEWFPQNIGHFDVFISHSHIDLTKIKQLSYWLSQNLGLRCFIDSVFWKYSNKLLEELDSRYSRFYDHQIKKFLHHYSKRNITTANVHCMLTMALMRMMDSCELVMFVDSDNSIHYERDSAKTPSPWIYEELEMANMLPCKMPKRRVRDSRIEYLNESELKMFSEGEENFTFMYDAKIKRFSDLTAEILQRVKNSLVNKIPKAEDSLDKIYILLKEKQENRFFL